MEITELCVVGAEDKHNAGDTIAAALDAIPPESRHIIYTTDFLCKPQSKGGLGLTMNPQHARRYIGVMTERGYCHKTATNTLTDRAGRPLWGHPDAIKVAREKGV
jgi:hypothetical protein